MIAKELVGHPDSRVLEDYVNGVGGPEVLEEVRGRHRGDEEWGSAIKWAIEARAGVIARALDERESAGSLFVPGGGARLETAKAGPSEALKKGPGPLQRDPRQPSWVRIGKPRSFAPKIEPQATNAVVAGLAEKAERREAEALGAEVVPIRPEALRSTDQLSEEERSRIVRLPAGEREEAFKEKQGEEEGKRDEEIRGPKAESAGQEPSRALVLVPPRAPVSDGFEAALAWMNEHHAIIDNVGGKCVIAGWEKSGQSPGKLVVVFQGKESFLLRYSNLLVSWQGPAGKTLSVPLGPWWLSHPDRAQWRGVTFFPGGERVVDDCLNLWRGWGVEPRPGDWSLMRWHIEQVIADGNKEYAEYVIRWIAWAIQNPAEMAEVALVLIGQKGAGKGTLVRWLQRIFGAHAFQVTNREQVIGRFNGHLQDCVLFIADEAYWGGDKRCVGTLQGMITEPTLDIERKGIDLIQVRNCLHVVMLAEPGWVIPAGRYERRYAALAVSEKRLGERPYFNALHKQMNEGGAEAMFWDLQGMDLGEWHPRHIPEALSKNAALQRQQGLTLPPLEQWYVMVLHEGRLPYSLPGRLNTTLTKRLMDNAVKRVPRLRWDLSEVGLRDFLIEGKDAIGIVCKKYRSAVANGWSFPPLAECRQAWEKRYGPTKWDHEVEEWQLPEDEDGLLG
jgi:hypothetical protein